MTKRHFRFWRRAGHGLVFGVWLAACGEGGPQGSARRVEAQGADVQGPAAGATPWGTGRQGLRVKASGALGIAGPDREPAKARGRASAPVRALSRQVRFRMAMLQLSRQFGVLNAAADMIGQHPCGGLSGPGCDVSTLAIELAKRFVPALARRWDVDAAVLGESLSAAITEHSIWHDAFGLLFQHAHKGPGYIYAGCWTGVCEPGNPLAGQVEGILFQLERLNGVRSGAPCESCRLDGVIERL